MRGNRREEVNKKRRGEKEEREEKDAGGLERAERRERELFSTFRYTDSTLST